VSGCTGTTRRCGLVSHGNRKYRLTVAATEVSRPTAGVNLTLAEIAELPLAAALVDPPARWSRRTPSGTGPGPGAVS